MHLHNAEHLGATRPRVELGDRLFEFALAASSVPNAVDAGIAAELHRHWSDDEIVEILGVIALFGFLHRWNDSMATTLEAPAAEVGAAHLAGRGWRAGKHGRS